MIAGFVACGEIPPAERRAGFDVWRKTKPYLGFKEFV
jgi:hypothetical protein